MPEDFDSARHAAEEYLARYPPSAHSTILRGAMVSVYSGETPASDAAIWIQGEKVQADTYVGVAQKSLNALRDIGTLDEIDQTSAGLLVYPNASVSVSMKFGE